MKTFLSLILLSLSICVFAEKSNTRKDSTDLNQEIVEKRTYKPHWSSLPIWGKEAFDLGHDLPIPIGVSFVFNKQTIDYAVEEAFSVDVERGTGPLGGLLAGSYLIPKDDVTIEGEDTSFQVRADAWILPFLNVFLVTGYTEGKKDVKASLKTVKPGLCYLIENIAGNCILPIPIEYTAVNFGGGIALAGQWEAFTWTPPIVFLAMGMGTNAWTDVLDSTIQMGVAQLKVGQRYNVPGGKLTYLIGYNYQYINQKTSGSYDFTGTALQPIMTKVDFDIHIVSDETSNMAVSLNYDFGKQEEWSVFAEYGFIAWDQLIVQLGRRF